MAKETETKKPISQITTPPFRVSFPNVFKPRGFEGQEAKYSVQMIFPKGTDLSKMKDFVEQTKRKKWGADKKEWPKFKHPVFKDGNEKNLEGYKDAIVVEARTKIKPGIVNREGEELISPTDFYAGCWARATLTCFPYSKGGNVGVSFGLSNLQKLKDDKAFSGRKNAKDDFDNADDLDLGDEEQDTDGGDDLESDDEDDI